MKEVDLFVPLKKHFKSLGYSVYAEVPCFYRGVDLVAVKSEKHVAIEMKLHFNYDVIRQADTNSIFFGYNYVAFPVKKPVIFNKNEDFWKLRESLRKKIEMCEDWGIGILEILPHGTVFEALEAKYRKPNRKYDFSQFLEDDSDVGGRPCQKGVSSGYYELKLIKAYVLKNPNADWQEIFNNVQNHYCNARSLAGSMKQWRGFDLKEYKKNLT